jgi:hypothetical protein
MNSISIHKDHFDILYDFTNEEIGQLVRALLADAVGDEEQLLPDGLNIVRKYINNQNKRFSESQSSKRKPNQPAEPNQPTEPNQPNEPKQPPNPLSLSLSNTIKEKDIGAEAPAREEKKLRVFIPPSVDEVRSYCTERGNTIDPEYFCDYYTARDWILNNRKKMSDWKAAVRYWEKNNFGHVNQPRAPAPKRNRFVNFKQRNWDVEQLEKMEREYLINDLNNAGDASNE